MVRISRTIRKVLQTQALRCAVLALVLPTMLVAPGQAGLLLLHRHCDESTHFHQYHHTDPDEWRDDHARQHSCEGLEHRESHESAAAVGDADCDHHTPILVLPFDKVQLSRPLRSSGSGMLGLSRTVSPAMAFLPAVPEDDLTRGRPPLNIPGADLATLDATAALLLRNHALLL